MTIWIKISSAYYDITDLISNHPGGSDILLKYQNKDATSIFSAQHGHNPLIWDKLQKYKMGAVQVSNVYIPEHIIEAANLEPCPLCSLVEKIPVYVARGNFRNLVAEQTSLFEEQAKFLASSENMALSSHVHADLSFIAIAYLREDDTEVEIPDYLVKPWKVSSDKLAREPMFDYVDCVLANWHDGEKKYMIRAFTGLKDETEFYRIHLLAELEINKFVEFVHEFRQADDELNVRQIEYTLNNLVETIKRFKLLAIDEMYKLVDPYIFYHRLRRFLGGFDNVTYQGLGQKSYPGATAAQSSMFEVIDNCLGLPSPTGQLKTILDRFEPHRDCEQKKYVHQMRQGSDIKYIIENCSSYCSDRLVYLRIVRLYNNLIGNIISFRELHMKLVNDYVLKFSPEATGTGGTHINDLLAPRKELTMGMYIKVPGSIDNPEAEQLLEESDHSTVTPWEVSGPVDYNKLIDKFGCQRIDSNICRLFQEALGPDIPLHRFIRRNIFFSHRDLDLLLNSYIKNQPFYLYTGRGPSSETMHLGHLVPFQFTAWLQKVFQVPLVIQMTDDEKYLFRSLDKEDLKRILYENVKDIIACGFDPKLTFIFSDFEYVGTMYPVVVDIWKRVTHNQLRGIFGFDDQTNAGCWAFPAIQAAPSFPQSFPHIFGDKTKVNCLIPQAIDQDPYFRMTRDVAPRMNCNKPALIHSTFFPSIKGPNSKMSSSDPNSTISLSDSDKEIQNKIMRYAFSGGQATKEDHQKFGGDTRIDVSFQLLRYFLEDDQELVRIRDEYESGRMLTAQIKKLAINCIKELIGQLRQRRAQITDQEVQLFMARRPLTG